MENINITQLKLDLNSLFAAFVGKKYDDIVFKDFHTQLRELLQRYDLSDLRLWVRPANFDKPVISISPIRQIDRLTFLYLLEKESQTISVNV
jgi:hypothetical protein